jgi:hypothetical protein
MIFSEFKQVLLFISRLDKYGGGVYNVIINNFKIEK